MKADERLEADFMLEIQEATNPPFQPSVTRHKAAICLIIIKGGMDGRGGTIHMRSIQEVL